MSRGYRVGLCLCLVLLSVLATRFGPFPHVNDRHDIGVYFERGSWMTQGQQPYRDVFSEYPQVATWLFALPHGIDCAWDRGGETQQRVRYRYLFSGLMAVFLAVTIAMLHASRPDRKWLAFLLLLPASAYFTQNRYDILPAFLTVASLFALRDQRFRTALALLGIATMTKWYPLVMAPVFIAYLYRAHRRDLAAGLISYGLALGLICLPTLLAVGWEGFMIPYQFHLSRGTNPESLLHWINRTVEILDIPNEGIAGVLPGVFLLLQFSVVPLCAMVRIDTWDKVVTWSALSILCFILFAKFYSPQWILWISPLLILLVRHRLEIAGIVMLDLVTYAYFPYLYHLPESPPFWFPGIIALKTALLGCWILRLAYQERVEGN